MKDTPEHSATLVDLASRRAARRPRGVQGLAVPSSALALKPALALVPADHPDPQTKPTLGALLVEMGVLRPAELARARAIRAKSALRLGDVLLSQGLITPYALFRALARLYGTTLVDLGAEPPDPRLIDRLGAATCLRDGFVPWRQVGNRVVVACAYPDRYAQISTRVARVLGPTRLVIAPLDDIRAALVTQRHRTLVERAETRVVPDEACRTWNARATVRAALFIGLLLAAALIAAPAAAWMALTLWAVAVLSVNSAVKLAATILHARRPAAPPAPAPRSQHDPRRRPVVSLLVPLYREREIAGRLVKRLGRLTYPRELLDICLIVEEDDTLTHKTLAAADLPSWMRQITVPRGGVRTKPRALNYALDYCRGSIIGVYDAEDRPDPDQIDKVARRFSEAPPKTACLQGILDYYNARDNWLSRCFTVEYATWFRLVLPGMAKLGFAIPLGGTTLFFRRAALESLGGWDAHNVTEDADLGMRLARHGYQTELIDTVTEEEANARWWPWIKQRSRWIKGYAMTYGVHMRAPRQLWRDMGPRKFLGFQIVFLGTLSHLVLAPVLWSYWLLAFGLPHPLSGALPGWATAMLFCTFLGSEAINIAAGMIAVNRPGRAFLKPWVPTLHLYFPLASLAAIKGLAEIAARPFFWDKTEHGVAIGPEDGPEPVPPTPVPPPTAIPSAPQV